MLSTKIATPSGSGSGPSGGGSATGGNPSGGSKGKGVCDQTSGASAMLTPSLGTVAIPTTVMMNSTGNDVGEFQLDNPSPCPMSLTMMRFVSHPSVVPSPLYGMLQNIKLIDINTGMQFGSTLDFARPIDMTGTMTFVSTAPVVVAPYTTENFSLMADTRNVPPPATFQIQWMAFNATNTTLGLVANWVYTTGAPIMAPLITIVL